MAPLFCEFVNLDQNIMRESVSIFGCIPEPKVGNPEPFMELTYKELVELEKGFMLDLDGVMILVRIVLVLTSGMYTYTYIHTFVFFNLF